MTATLLRVTRSVYLASPEGLTGKSAIAVGLLDALTREVGSVGVFRPLTHNAGDDLIVDLLVSQPGVDQTYEDALGVTYEAARRDADEAMHTVVERFGQLTERYQAVMVLGSDYTDISTGTELTLNARIAANLGSPVLLVVHGRRRTPIEVRSAAGGALNEMRANHAHVVALVANRVDAAAQAEIVTQLQTLGIGVVAAVPDDPILSAPTVRSLAAAVDAPLVLGTESWLDRESLGLKIAAMSLPNILPRLRPDDTVIMASDRPELIPGLMLAHQSGTFPRLAGIVLTGGYPIPDSIIKLSEGVANELPIVSTELGTYTTAERLSRVPGPMLKSSTKKLEVARRLFSEHVDQEALLGAINISGSAVRTPLMFEFQLMERARSVAEAHRAAGEHRRPDPRGGGRPAPPRRGPVDPARRRDLGTGPGLQARPRPRSGGGGLHHRPGAGRTLRRRLRRGPQAQGHDGRGRPRHRHRRVVLRHHDGPPRPGGRDGVGRGEHHRPHHPPRTGVREDQTRGRTPCRACS